FAFAVEIRLPRLRIAGENVLDFEDGRATECIVDALVDEMGQLLDLGLAEVGAWSAALSGVPLTQIGSNLAPVPVVQDKHRADQVRPTFGAPGIGPMTGAAFCRPDLLAAFSRRGIHYMFILRPRSTTHSPGGLCRGLPAGARDRRRLGAEIDHDCSGEQGDWRTDLG